MSKPPTTDRGPSTFGRREALAIVEAVVIACGAGWLMAPLGQIYIAAGVALVCPCLAWLLVPRARVLAALVANLLAELSATLRSQAAVHATSGEPFFDIDPLDFGLTLLMAACFALVAAGLCELARVLWRRRR